MKNLFADIFRSLLLGLRGPPPAFLVGLILEYIEICFSIAKSEDIDQLLRITVHFLKNIENTPENGQFFERVLMKVVQAGPKLTKIVEEDTTDYFLEIVEEFITIGLNPQVFDYPAYLVQLYTTLSKTDDGAIELETAFRLKSTIFSIYTTLLLMALEKGEYRLADFEVGSPVLRTVDPQRDLRQQRQVRRQALHADQDPVHEPSQPLPDPGCRRHPGAGCQRCPHQSVPWRRSCRCT